MQSRPRILVVDDEPRILDSIRRNLVEQIDQEWDLAFAGDGNQALELVAAEPVQVVVTDIAMPGMDGHRLVQRLNALHPEIVPIVLSGHWSQSQAFGQVGPGVRFLAKPVGKELLAWTIREAIAEHDRRRTAVREAGSVPAARPPSPSQAATARRSQKATLSAMANLAEFRDAGTGSHVLRVARMTHEIARTLHRRRVEAETCDAAFVQHVGMASVLHDVGKVGIPDAVLLKPGRLNDQERLVMQGHAELGRQLLERTGGLFDGDALYFKLAADIAGGHHEWWNGEGYPQRLAGRAIPLAARIVAVADVYDALISNRPYKQAWAGEEVLRHITSRSGSQFDPAVVEVFLAVLAMRAEAPVIDWDDRIAVGHPQIDDEHRRLLELINQLSLRENADDPIVIEFAMDELMDYVHQHFDNEERLLREIGYPDLDLHCRAHARMLDHAHILNARFLQNGTPVGQELSVFLRRWMVAHIMEEDQSYKDHLAHPEAAGRNPGNGSGRRPLG